jgi:phosphoribosylanthranilate isomerase
VLRLCVSGISSLTDARYCAGMGVEYLSFQVDESGKSSLALPHLRAIRPWIEGVKWMGEFTGNAAAIFSKITEDFQADAWLLASGTDSLKSSHSEIWFNFHPSNPDAALPETNLKLIPVNFSEDALKRLLAKAFRGPGQVMLAGIQQPEQALKLAAEFPELIFSLESGPEERPGWMDLSALQDFLEALDQD